MAGAVGIEPTQAVLETAVLPLYDAPKSVHDGPKIQNSKIEIRKLFGFLVQSFLFAEFAVLLQFQTLLGVLLVLLGLVVQVVTNRALQVNQVVLGHGII